MKNPDWQRFRTTKFYDFLSASPLIAFNVLAVAGLVMRIAEAVRGDKLFASVPDALNSLSLLSLLAFLAAQVGCLVARGVPKRFSDSWLSRAVALTGANAGLAMLLLPRAALSPALQIASSCLTFLGALASTWVTIWLGRNFSIFPQARRLVTGGPYRFVRHPLYLAETVTTLGIVLQYRQPWALLVAIAVTAFQVWRLLYEERILAATYPEYRGYSLRTARLLPGIF